MKERMSENEIMYVFKSHSNKIFMCIKNSEKYTALQNI